MYKLFIYLFIFSFWFNVAGATSVLSLVENGSSGLGGEVRIMVELDTDKNIVNGFDIILSYDENILKFVGYSGEGSVNALWVKTPQASKNQVAFSGIIPGGASVTYDPNNTRESRLKLVELIFKAQKQDSTKIDIQESSVFLNDGLGTKVKHEVKNVVLNISGTKSNEVSPDSKSPLNFTISLIPKSKEANTPNLLVFSADDESGIASYKIKNSGKWQEVTSPYPVKQKIFSSRISIRAYDVYGNMTESSIAVPGIVPLYTVPIFLVLFLAGFYIYKLLK